MNDEQHAVTLADTVQQQLPWLATAALGAWGATLRFLLGRQVRANDITSQRLGKIEQRIARIEGHLGVRHDPWDDQE